MKCHDTPKEAWQAWDKPRQLGILGRRDVWGYGTRYYIAPKLNSWREFANQRAVNGSVRWLCTECGKYYARRRPCCGQDTVMITEREARELGKLKGRQARIGRLIEEFRQAVRQHNSGTSYIMYYKEE